MTHHLLSARCVKEQLRRPGSCSEGPLSNVHDHGTYSRYHYISMISVCWGGMILFSIYCLRVVLMSFLAIPHNGKLCDPPACFLKIRKTALLAVPAAAIQQLQLLAALQAENHGIKHYCRQHHCMPSILCLYPQDVLFPRHSPVSFFWNSFPENGRRTIATTSWREAA